MLLRYKIFSLLFLVISCSHTFAQNWDQIVKSTSNPRNDWDYYGFTVAMDGDYAVVGAPYHDYDQYNINFIGSAGAVFILKKDQNDHWVQHQKITAPDRVFWDVFGYSVNIQNDAIIVGAIGNDRDINNKVQGNNVGAAYIFRKLSDGLFYFEQKLIPSISRDAYENFGFSVDIDGKYAIIGKRLDSYNSQNKDSLFYAGSAYIYEKHTNGNWLLHKKITPSDREALDQFGRSVSISGNHAIISSYGSKYAISKTDAKPYAGAAYIYTNFNGVWSQNQKITATNRRQYNYFGSSVSIDDSLIVVGVNRDFYDAYENNFVWASGSAHIFKLDGFIWKHYQKIVPIDRTVLSSFGTRVNVNNNTIVVGANNHQNDLKYQNPLRNAGAAYVFQLAVNKQYSQVSKLVAQSRDSLDNFGFSIATQGDYVVVGAYLEDDDANNLNPKINTGSSYIYKTCDSRSEIDIIACQTYISPSQNHTWTESGTYKDVIKNARGCDSIISINLTITQPDTQRIKVTACESYLSPSGKFNWTKTGQYVDRIQSAEACDSIKIIDLTINKISFETVDITHCGPFQSPSGNYTWSKNGTYNDIIPNMKGCDSLITVNLRIVEPTYATHYINACKTYKSFSGRFTWHNTGIYSDTILNEGGCDSILTIILTINKADTGVVNFGNQLIAKANNGLYRWLDCNNNYARVWGAHGQSFYPKENGSYALDVADNGCRDTSSCYAIYRVNVPNLIDDQISIYPNPSSNYFNLNNKSKEEYHASMYNSVGVLIESFKLNASANRKVDLTMQAAGVYYLKLTDSQGVSKYYSMTKK